MNIAGNNAVVGLSLGCIASLILAVLKIVKILI